MSHNGYCSQLCSPLQDKNKMKTCTAYLGKKVCPIRFDCQLYSNYLKPFVEAEIGNSIIQPKPIAMEHDGKYCKNFKQK